MGSDVVRASSSSGGLIVGDKRYKRLPGLWHLIATKQPELAFAAKEDVKDYAQIMIKTNPMKYPKCPQRAVANKSLKWEKIIKPTREKQKRNKRDQGFVHLGSLLEKESSYPVIQMQWLNGLIC